MSHTKQGQKGFSLINGMLALGVVGILFGAVVPSVTAIVLDNRATTEVQEISKAFQLARSAAVTQRKAVIVSAVDSNWSEGIEIWVDHNGDQQPSADEILYTLPALSTEAQLVERSGQADFTFDRRGFAKSRAAFDYVAEGGCSWNHEVKVKYTGRTAVSQPGCL